MIDASVAIKWMVDEPGTAQAWALLRFRLIESRVLRPMTAMDILTPRGRA